jgi:hypothetical protein
MQLAGLFAAFFRLEAVDLGVFDGRAIPKVTIGTVAEIVTDDLRLKN